MALTKGPYIIVEGTSPGRLANAVNEEIEKSGRIPVGAPLMFGHSLYQAMVKETQVVFDVALETAEAKVAEKDRPDYVVEKGVVDMEGNLGVDKIVPEMDPSLQLTKETADKLSDSKLPEKREKHPLRPRSQDL